MNEFVRLQWLGNSVEHWLIALGIFLFCFLVFASLKNLLLNRTKKRMAKKPTKLDGILLVVAECTRPFFLLFLSVHLASNILDFRPHMEHLLESFVKLSLFLQIGLWGNGAIRYGVQNYSARGNRDSSRITTLSSLGFLLQIGLWILIGLLALNNFGVNVSALIAGFGIGGIAIALAVQNILGDLLAALSIVMDKPFVLGDTIAVGADRGMVEHIGLKSTRLKSSSGEQLIFSNSELLKTRIRNYKYIHGRQVNFQFSVDFQTPQEKLQAIPSYLKEILTKIPGTEFERCHLVQLSSSAINYELIYSIHTQDYGAYLDSNQALNLALLDKFRREKISIPYPTQTIYTVEANEKR